MSNNKTLDEMARVERLAYYKEWRAANKDKVARNNANYWRKRAATKQQESQNDKVEE